MIVPLVIGGTLGAVAIVALAMRGARRPRSRR